MRESEQQVCTSDLSSNHDDLHLWRQRQSIQRGQLQQRGASLMQRRSWGWQQLVRLIVLQNPDEPQALPARRELQQPGDDVHDL